MGKIVRAVLRHTNLAGRPGKDDSTDTPLKWVVTEDSSHLDGKKAFGHASEFDDRDRKIIGDASYVLAHRIVVEFEAVPNDKASDPRHHPFTIKNPKVFLADSAEAAQKMVEEFNGESKSSDGNKAGEVEKSATPAPKAKEFDLLLKQLTPNSFSIKALNFGEQVKAKLSISAIDLGAADTKFTSLENSEEFTEFSPKPVAIKKSGANFRVTYGTYSRKKKDATGAEFTDVKEYKSVYISVTWLETGVTRWLTLYR